MAVVAGEAVFVDGSEAWLAWSRPGAAGEEGSVRG
jgi:hypothetical protein